MVSIMVRGVKGGNESGGGRREGRGGGGVEGEEMKVAIYLGEWETVVLNVDNAREERGR